MTRYQVDSEAVLSATSAVRSSISRIQAEVSGATVLDDWIVFELLGVFLGGLVGAYSAGRLRLGVIRGAGVKSSTRLALAFSGGLLMGVAARAARGCTSGQALSGAGTDDVLCERRRGEDERSSESEGQHGTEFGHMHSFARSVQASNGGRAPSVG